MIKDESVLGFVKADRDLSGHKFYRIWERQDLQSRNRKSFTHLGETHKEFHRRFHFIQNLTISF